MKQPNDNQSKLSFLPEDYVQRRIEQRTNMICLSLFAVVLVGVLGAHLVTKGGFDEEVRKNRQVSEAYADAAKRIAQLNELQQRKKLLMSKAQVTATLIEPVPRSNLMAELINRMPSTLSLSECTLGSKKIAPPRPPVEQNRSALANARDEAAKKKAAVDEPPPAPRYLVTLNLVGLAPTDIQVAQYMTSLARCELLEEVDLVYSEAAQVNDITMRRFKITMTIDPNADIRCIDPTEGEPDVDDIRNGFEETRMQAVVDPSHIPGGGD